MDRVWRSITLLDIVGRRSSNRRPLGANAITYKWRWRGQNERTRFIALPRISQGWGYLSANEISLAVDHWNGPSFLFLEYS